MGDAWGETAQCVDRRRSDQQRAVPFRWNGGVRVDRNDSPAVVRSGLFWICVIQPPPQPGFPAPESGQEKFNSRLVVPIRLQPLPAQGFVFLQGDGI